MSANRTWAISRVWPGPETGMGLGVAADAHMRTCILRQPIFAINEGSTETEKEQRIVGLDGVSHVIPEEWIGDPTQCAPGTVRAVS